jgi:glycyl-tRNA synthetase beta chain
MVGEFPELQGVVGRYYAAHDSEPHAVADALRDHYAPKGPTDLVPAAPVSIAVALADKLDQLVGFFSIGEKPTGSGDPYALRRAALGIIRIIRENRLRLRLRQLVQDALEQVLRRVANQPDDLRLVDDVIAFLVERLRVQLRAEGARHDVLAAVFAAKGAQGADDDLTCLLARTEAVAALLGTADGSNLLTAYRRAANILRIETRKDGPHDTPPDASLLRETAEIELDHALGAIDTVSHLLAREDFAGAMSELARLRAPLDAFFDKVTVNAPEPELRRNRLQLLHRVQAAMDRVADFSRLEG